MKMSVKYQKIKNIQFVLFQDKVRITLSDNHLNMAAHCAVIVFSEHRWLLYFYSNIHLNIVGKL